MSEQRRFENLCLEPGSGGFSYDTALLVDVDRSADFDESVIRLITKCNSIITQLSALSNIIDEFSVTAAKINPDPKSPSGNKGKRSFGNPNAHISTPEGRNLHTMEDQWSRLKRKNFSGLVAVARLTRSSIPRNGSGSKYSVEVLTQALLSHVQAYFMFQSYNPTFQRLPTPVPRKDDGQSDDEYLLYLMYRIQPVRTEASPAIPNILPIRTPTSAGLKKYQRLGEIEKLDLRPFGGGPLKRRRHTSGESSISSSSSVSSNPSGGPSYLSPPVTTPTTLTHNTMLSPDAKDETFDLDWTNYSSSRANTTTGPRGRKGSDRGSASKATTAQTTSQRTNRVLRNRQTIPSSPTTPTTRGGKRFFK